MEDTSIEVYRRYKPIQMNSAGLFTFFFAIIMYMKAAITQIKNLIMKLPYMALTDACGFGERNERIEIQNESDVAIIRTRLPTMATSWSTPCLASHTLLKVKSPLKRINTSNMGVQGCNLLFIFRGFGSFPEQLIKYADKDEQR
jgi:hypothetical protein